MRSAAFAALALMASASLVAASYPSRVIMERDAYQSPSAIPVPGAITCAGCWSSGGNMTTITEVAAHLVSSGSCTKACIKLGYPITGLHGDTCLCGFALPPLDDVADDSKCTYPCPSYPLEACGGLESPTYFTVWNNGVSIDPPNYSAAPSSSTSSTASPTSTTSASSTATQSSTTSAPAATTSSSSSDGGSSGPNAAAIAAGVVVGVVLVAAAIGGGFFYLRRKRNAEIEEEHRRNAAVNAFISGSQPPPSSSGSISMTDSRMDPVLAHRRLSDGSIADNQDYSRKILRVTNA